MNNGFRFFVHNDPDAVRVELAGSLGSVDVEPVRQAWARAVLSDARKPVIVDITFVTDADEHGRALLLAMHRFGAQIVAQSPESSAIARQLLAELIGTDGSKPGWFHRLMMFLLEEPPAGAALPAHAENLNHASAGSRHARVEYMGLRGRGMLEDVLR